MINIKSAIKRLIYLAKRRKFLCLIGIHDWFDADGWLGKDDQYCIFCFKERN
ncbi:hypothetical protein KAR91_07160 [Candidatus Pacearchaeota archaeon]|nr:hypothetical protein [Candidatus Pacearchaeota archaeon]